MNDSQRNFKLSIIIPCYNEIDTIQELIFRVKSSPIQSKEIIQITHQLNQTNECVHFYVFIIIYFLNIIRK